MHLSRADHSLSPPLVDIPRDYNAAHDLLSRNASRSGKPAFIDAASGNELTFGDLRGQAHRCEVLDGIGSTEMLHTFLSNRPGEMGYGTTGKPVA